LLDDIEARLLLGYQWECFRELAHQREDVHPEALFAIREPIRLPDERDCDPFDMADQGPEEWLRRYSGDADFRNFHHRRILRLIEGPLPPVPPELPPVGQLVVTIVALRQWTALPEDPSPAFRETANASLSNMGDEMPRLFQVGGRERLLDACACFQTMINALLQPGQEIIEIRSPADDPRRSLLTDVATRVFLTRGFETGVLLLRKGLHDWRSAFDPGFYWPPEDFQDLREAIRMGDPDPVWLFLTDLRT
jgi:hypothetical protein